MVDRKSVLVNDMALQMRPDALDLGEPGKVFVAGSNLVRMTLAELALPGAEIVWTDFRHSASLGALHQVVQAAGGVDRMILATDGEHGEAAFSMMCAVLTLLPSLRRKGMARVELICSTGKAAQSLGQFVERIRPQLDRENISVSLDVLAPDRTDA